MSTVVATGSLLLLSSTFTTLPLITKFTVGIPLLTLHIIFFLIIIFSQPVPYDG